MWYVLALLSSLTFGLASFLMKVSSAQRGSVVHFLCGLYLTGSLGFLAWSMLTGAWELSFSVLVGGLVIGVGTSAGNLLFMRGLDHGPASLTSPVVNSNVILTVGMSIALFGEAVSTLNVLGIALLVLAVALLPFDPSEDLRITSFRWYALTIAAAFLFFLRNGGLKVTEELDLPNTSVLLIGYLSGLLWFSLTVWRKERETEALTAAATGLKWGLLSGVFSFTGMQVYAAAVAAGPASLVSPIFSTNSLVVATLSILVYRERLSALQISALCMLAAGLALVRM
jgi:uncharacterized membrane protein